MKEHATFFFKHAIFFFTVHFYFLYASVSMILIFAPPGWIFFGSGGASSLSKLADRLLEAAWLRVESLTLRPVGCAGLPGSIVSLT